MVRVLGAGALVASLWIAAGACGGGDDDFDISVVDGSPGDADDAGPPDDDNDSFDEAISVDIGDPGRRGVIDVPGDQDFYVFEGAAGQWLELSALPEDFSIEILPIVTLYDSNETQIAESFILATRLPASGTYYAKVEDLWSIFGDPTTVGGPDASYVFDIVELLDGVDDYYFDMELGDDAASAVTIPASGGLFFPSMVGLYDHAADRDVFSFTLDGTGTQYFDAYVSAPGPNGNGSTSDFNELWITDATGSEILARIDSDQFSLTPPLPSPASYLLWVEKGATAPAANDFYEVSCFGGVDDNPEELEPPATTGANDTIALADAAGEDVELTADGAFFITYLPAGDVDYIGFDASSGLAIEAFCVAADFGSGLLGMTGEIRDSSDTTLSSATEPSAVVLDTTLPGAGRYYFRLSAAGQDPEVTGNWVRCRLRVPSF